ncbi:malonyl-coenzyme A:anthocyanin 3-O-glucoside-6''-O-malonyltransferase-like [Apium graveolens]|uniref:malonyl-coenzyme A:anthocyanin 3-O-glucoside-6''-O-malonyltransferase-like n=1 Tax=Apium graveolens TaxID=4045 RepID=UPI003D7A54DF
MENQSLTVNVLEHCGVSPPADTVKVTSLPLNFFDLMWLTFHPLGRVIFFDFPYSTSHFIEHTLPNLKTSLSLALKHFTPLAGNLVAPCDTNSNTEFLFRYLDGDSVSVTVAECTDDLDYLIGIHARDASMLNAFVPQLPSATCVEISGKKCSVAPVFAIQITVFPRRAICIGIRSAHAVADGSSLFNFARAWASINKQVGLLDAKDDINELVTSDGFQIPSFERSSIKDPHDLSTLMVKVLGPRITEQIEKLLPQEDIVQDSTKIMVKTTFFLTGGSIQDLKKTILTKRPTITYLSSFTAACAYLWTCFAKTRATIGGEVHNLDECQNFGFTMDCRARLDPPLPASYFGNCLAPCLGVLTGRVLVGDEGLVAAAEVFGNNISMKLKGGPLHGSDKWLDDFAGAMRGEWTIGIAGSPKLDYYNDIDFGWGKPLKFEFVEEPLSMSRCKDSNADLEIGIVLPKNEMDVFSTIFAQGLQSFNT